MNIKNISLLLFILFFFGAIIYFRKSTQFSSDHKKTLRVGVNVKIEPFTFMKDDEFVGFDIDLINAIANELDAKIEFRTMPFDALIPGLQLGTINLAISAITPTNESQKQLLFTTPYFVDKNPFVIITHKHRKDIATFDDLADKDVAVCEGFATDSYVSSKPNITIKRYSNLSESFAALKNNQVDAFVTIKNTVKPLLKDHKHDFVMIKIPETQADYAIAVSKKYPDLQTSIQRVLDKFTKDDTLRDLKKRWNV